MKHIRQLGEQVQELMPQVCEFRGQVLPLPTPSIDILLGLASDT